MAGGLRFESLADMPEQMRKQVAGKILGIAAKESSVAGGSASEGGKEPSATEWLSKQLHTPKYHNVKTEVNGIRFDSKKEARRYQQLRRALEAGAISDLRLQVDFTHQEAYTTPEGQRIQAIRYRAEFTYKMVSAGYDALPLLGHEDIEYWRGMWPGALVVEDVKSRATKTGEYMMKKKMMADKGYIIREV